MIPPITHPDGSRSWGYIPDSLANRRKAMSAHKLVTKLPRATSVPKSYSLAAFNAPIFDQGEFGSCTGHGTAQGIYTTAAARGKKLPFIPSPRELYTVTRCLERTTSPRTGKPTALTDSGAMPTDLIETTSEFGILPIGPMANDGRQSDVDSTNINSEPDLVQLESAALNLELGLYRIDQTAPNAVAQIQACVAEGIAVGIGFFCDTLFQNWNPSKGPLDVVDLTDRDGGGHWISLDTYDTSTGGIIALGLTNSWSRSFGVGGHIEVTSAWFDKAVSDVIPFALEL